MKKIPLRNIKKEIIAYALVDDEDFERLGKLRWHANRWTRKTHHTWYARHSFRYPEEKKTRHLFLHSEIIGKPPEGMQIDHINRNGLDNRKENLRIVSKNRNMLNTGKRTNNTSGVTGVVRMRGKWHAQMNQGKKKKHIGFFDNLEEAKNAYQKEVNRYWTELGA